MGQQDKTYKEPTEWSPTAFLEEKKGLSKERLSITQPGEWIKTIMRDHQKGTSEKALSRRGRIVEGSSRSKRRDLTMLFNPFMCIVYLFIHITF